MFICSLWRLLRIRSVGAERAGFSISKFVVERVEDSTRREEGEEGYPSRAELVKRLRSAEDELKKLREENRLLKRLVENLDNGLKRYRSQPFLHEAFEGVRRFNRDLIELLRRGESYTEEEILAYLNIQLLAPLTFCIKRHDTLF
jgi:hypothetical protein